MDDLVPICCLCFKVRDDKGVEVGQGPWVDLKTYAVSRQLPLSHGFLFSHTYCSDCVPQFNESMAPYRPTNVFGSLRDIVQRLSGLTS
jgi:hypothetical protein